MACAFCEGTVGHPGEINSYKDFCNEVEYVWNSLESSGWRRGQTIMNVLGRVNPKLYEEVSGTPADPFFEDNRIDDLVKFLQERMLP